MATDNKTRLYWKHLGLIQYESAMDIQEKYQDRLLENSLDMFLLTLEHTGTITMGRTSKRDEVFLSDEELRQKGLELHVTNRGGKCTCHVPGQLVGYPILDIRRLGLAVDTLVHNMEECMIGFLKGIGIEACRNEKNPGAWVGESKIGYIGLNIHKGITTHGFAMNLSPDLSVFSYFVPCGMDDCENVSVKELNGKCPGVEEAAERIAENFSSILGLELVKETTVP